MRPESGANLRNHLFSVLAAGCTAILVFIVVAPLVTALAEMLRTSMTQPPRGDELLFAAGLSLKTATLSATLALVIGTPAAWLLARRRFPGRVVVDTILDLPLVISPIAIGAMLLVFFKTGPGAVLESLCGPFVFELRGIVLAQFVVVMGLAVRLMKSVFEEIDPEYENVARTLGCSAAGAFRRVTLPMARRGLGAALLMVWARALGEFGATVTLAGAMPFKTATIPVAIYLSYGAADISGMMALILMATLLAFAVLLGMRLLGRISSGGDRHA